ncbi:MAG: tetratricopeptide repeat protein, partial [Dechloromonas sp.]
CSSAPRQAPAIEAIDRHLLIGSRLYQAGQLGEAKAAFRRAILAAELIDDSRHLVDALLASAASELLLGDLASATASYRRAQQEARQAGLPEAAIQAEIGLAEAARHDKQTAEAIRRFRQLNEQPALSPGQRTQIINGLSLSLIAQGDTEMAASLLLPIEPAANAPASALAAGTLANLARLRLQQGQLAEAERLAISALQMDRQLLHPPAIAADHVLLGEVMQRAGRPDEAGRHLETAQRIFRQTGQPQPVR